MKRGRRWAMQFYGTAEEPRVWWCAWRLFERVEGWAPSEEHARDAIDHFLSSKTSYTLG